MGVLPAGITQHWQATAGVLGSGLDSPVQDRHGHTGASPAKDHENND